MNGNQQSRMKDWPMVPIFGRRKRTREAFHVQPSQTFGSCESEEIISTTTNFPKQNEELDENFELMDIDNEDILENAQKRNMNTSYERISTTRSKPFGPMQNTRAEKTICKSTYSSPYQNQDNVRSTKVQIPELAKITRKEANIGKVSTNQNLNIDVKPIQPENKAKSSARREPIVPRMLTVSTESLKEIIAYKEDMILALYELYGILDSTVSSINGQTAKRFVVKDDTGIIRCIFWEIDRPFPQIRRGTPVRCVGRVANEGFQCLSIRMTNQSEVSLSKTLLKESKKVIDEMLIRRREY